jgi:hypothetical protein
VPAKAKLTDAEVKKIRRRVQAGARRSELARAYMFEIGTIVSYRGRLHVFIGITPMSVTPPQVKLEDTESGRILRVRGDDPQLVVEATKRLPADDE